MSEHKYNDAYNKGYEKGKQEAFTGYCMQCYDELSKYEQAKLMVELGADISNILDKNGWIPVSEPPKSSGVYNVTRKFGVGFEEVMLSDACYFDGKHWHNDNRINHGREYVNDEIVAWMPLPEPYKVKNEIDRDNYCKDCKRSIYGEYKNCDVNIANNGYYPCNGECNCKIQAEIKKEDKDEI